MRVQLIGYDDKARENLISMKQRVSTETDKLQPKLFPYFNNQDQNLCLFNPATPAFYRYVFRPAMEWNLDLVVIHPTVFLDHITDYDLSEIHLMISPSWLSYFLSFENTFQPGLLNRMTLGGATAPTWLIDRFPNTRIYEVFANSEEPYPLFIRRRIPFEPAPNFQPVCQSLPRTVKIVQSTWSSTEEPLPENCDVFVQRGAEEFEYLGHTRKMLNGRFLNLLESFLDSLYPQVDLYKIECDPNENKLFLAIKNPTPDIDYRIRNFTDRCFDLEPEIRPFQFSDLDTIHGKKTVLI